MEDNGKGRGSGSRDAPSSSGHKHPCTIRCSTRDARPVIQELTTSGTPDMVSAGSQSISRILPLLQHQHQHLGRLPSQYCSLEPKDGFEVLLRSRKELMQEQRRMQTSDQERALASKALRTLSKATKGKGIIGCEEAEINVGDKVSSSEVMEAIRGNERVSFQVAESSLGLKSSDRGISLREMLRPGHNKMDKVESLGLFRRIVELVDFAHVQDIVLLDLRPSCFYLHPPNKVRYVGSSARLHFSATALARDSRRKMPHEHAGGSSSSLPIPTCSTLSQNNYTSESNPLLGQSLFNSSVLQSERRWYTCPKEFGGVSCSIADNIYNLGVLLFELVCCFESLEAQCAGMSYLSDRILPARFLAENPMEAGVCLRLLHPDLASRPTTREILQSELLPKPPELKSTDIQSISSEENETEPDMLLHFLVFLRAQKTKHAAKLANDIGTIEEDLRDIHKRFRLNASSYLTYVPRSGTTVTRKLSQLEEAYFSTRAQPQKKGNSSQGAPLRTQERWMRLQNETNEPSRSNDTSTSHFGAFFSGLCKFARYSMLKEKGSLRNRDLLSSSKVIRALDLSRDEDYVATAGVSKKIKIYGVEAILDNAIDIHYPVVEITNNSKLSCICWNSYIRNYIASTDYDGIVKIWDTNTGQGWRQYAEHQKRAWAVDFCLVDPTKFASSSDDCSVKLWQLNERNSVSTIWNPANVCCIQFSPDSAHLLAFGCADNKIYCYDMRQTRAPWSTLAGHAKTVSYVKFMDSESIISASTDNTLKLWNLKQKSSAGLSSADDCALTFRGHTNEKNFVGLSVWDGYIACGSETNEVFTYYKSMPSPISSLWFGSPDTVSGSNNENEEGHFVSTVCWGKNRECFLLLIRRGT
ncbi:hypothetical protein MLD38_018248 [Melastoma candidum]|uniref:Uncharacterized protein n=1 Tax=Melastoma candidum TaxID=119954 RepID=A0ACB9R1H3_9MYRT|nr:hypothetical protein MLD38_018248 [Melastoma candidum]